MKRRHNLTIFLNNFSTNFRRNSTRKIVRWFEELINLNHLTIFITEYHQKLVEKLSKKIQLSLALIAAWSVFHLTLRECETPPSPPTPDPVGIENCKQLFSPLLAFTTKKIATHSTGITSAICVAFFWVVNASRNEKICFQFLIPTTVFHMLLRRCDTLWSAREIASVALSAEQERHTENVFHIALRKVYRYIPSQNTKKINHSEGGKNIDFT